MVLTVEIGNVSAGQWRRGGRRRARTNANWRRAACGNQQAATRHSYVRIGRRWPMALRRPAGRGDRWTRRVIVIGSPSGSKGGSASMPRLVMPNS